eukprot:SAG11_NODE_145_length_14811_cov_24.558931_5_plen_92_part_00
MMVVEKASATSLALASLVGKGGQVPAAALGVRGRDDQVVMGGRETAPAPRFAATAHERALIGFIPCPQPYVEGGAMKGGDRGANKKEAPAG